MAEGTRPGGLTALAVLNFVFGGFTAIGVLIVVALLGLAEAATGGVLSEEIAKSIAHEGRLGWGVVMAILALGIAIPALLIISGVGYIKQKRVLGRTMGNLYGIVALLVMAVRLYTGKELGVVAIIDLIYPVLTLIMINTTFKEDLVN